MIIFIIPRKPPFVWDGDRIWNKEGDMPMTSNRITDIQELVSPFREKVEQLIGIIKEKNLPFVVFETYRPQERQDKLYAQGRTKIDGKWRVTNRGNIVTYTIKSNHTARKAVDFVLKIDGVNPWDTSRAYLPHWFDLGEAAESLGLVWGGRFARGNQKIPKGQRNTLGWDAGHVEDPTNGA